MPQPDRIQTTHIGSLPRPQPLIDAYHTLQAGDDIDPDHLHTLVTDATQDVVERQDEIGIDIGNNGEQARGSFNFYAANRLTGYAGETEATFWQDLTDYPSYADRAFGSVDVDLSTRPAATDPVTYVGADQAHAEVQGFQQALAAVDPDFDETFITAAAPGIVASSLGNTYYDTYDEYVFAVADAISEEYAIYAEETDGYLQIDGPDVLAMHHRIHADKSTAEYLDVVDTHIAALNHALDGVDSERVRLHTCWGNYEGPHHHDIPLEQVLPKLYDADIGTLSIEFANPRHHHEVDAFTEHPLPDDWRLMPGVIDTTTNIIEHPETVADRLERFAGVVDDPGRLVAAPDCGFGTLAGLHTVDPEIAWAKLEAMVEGAAIASNRLF